jgi:hypothetical protein
MKACMIENVDGTIGIGTSTFLPESQSVIKTLEITPELARDYHHYLVQLAEHNRVQLLWVPGYEGIEMKWQISCLN